MSQEQRMKGSIEITTQSGNNPGMAGTSINIDAIPAVLDAMYSIGNVAPVAPEPVNGRMPVAQWSGTDAQGMPVTVKLWPEPVLDLAALADALAAEQGGD